MEYNSICPNCGKETYQKMSLKEKGHKKFCDNACYREYYKKSKILVCQFCGKEFMPSRSNKNKAQKHCSRSCSNYARTGIKYDGIRPNCKVSKVQKQREQLIELRGNFCELCKMVPEWNGLPLTFQVDHIDGDRTNESLSNLRLLCPNCHTQTPTYGSKNWKAKKHGQM